MAKKVAPSSAKPASPKRLRRRLEKLEGRLASASDKRDRAQARVDALAILADEVRAALAAAEADAGEPVAAHTPSPAPPTRAASKPHTARVAPSTRSRRTTRSTTGRSTRTGATRSTPTRSRRRPPSGGSGASGGGAS
jgi:hypothetical protein